VVRLRRIHHARLLQEFDVVRSAQGVPQFGRARVGLLFRTAAPDLAAGQRIVVDDADMRAFDAAACAAARPAGPAPTISTSKCFMLPPRQR
jgi:hypothetical protein